MSHGATRLGPAGADGIPARLAARASAPATCRAAQISCCVLPPTSIGLMLLVARATKTAIIHRRTAANRQLKSFSLKAIKSRILMSENDMPRHAEWLKSLEQEIAGEYSRLHAEAQQDPQRAGHGGEMTWVRILRQWLPPSYKVVTRKYIIPEVDAPSSETDIVVLNPSYPEPLQDRHEILFGDVAAAFSVKLTLNSAGIRDGVSRAVQLRRGMGKRFGSPREEMLAPFPVGLLAHSHSWRSPGSTPRDNITQQLRSLDDELAEHPRESLDYVCVADLGFWWTMRTPFLPAGPAGMLSTALTGKPAGVALSGIGQTEESEI
jgi:hypothetical protein